MSQTSSDLMPDVPTPPDRAFTDPSQPPSADERTWGTFAHLSVFFGYCFPLGNLIGPLVVRRLKKNTSPFVDDQAKEALNFQITCALAFMACIPLIFVWIGIPLIWLVALHDTVFTIIAAVKANEGIKYRYPYTLRFIKGRVDHAATNGKQVKRTNNSLIWWLILAFCIFTLFVLGGFRATDASFLLGLGIIFLVIISAYFIAPLWIKRLAIHGIHVEYLPIELSAMPPELSPFFSLAAKWLPSAGFKPLGHLMRKLPERRQEIYSSIWTNKSTMETAQIVGICTATSSSVPRSMTQIAFRSEYSDGMSIVTTNSPSPSALPPDPAVNVIICPGAMNLELLHRFHRARVRRDRGNQPATLKNSTDAKVRMIFDHDSAYQRRMHLGYFVIDQSKGLYVPTYWGAYLMTWRLLPPFKQIQQYKTKRLADETLRELGFGGLKEFVKTPMDSDP